MIKEKRRKKKRRMLALKIVLGVLVTLVLAFLVVFYVFRVEDVEVKGNVLYDKPTIESVVLNDEYSWNSLYVFLKYKLVDTKDVPFIDTMEVSLKSPTTLQIQVYENGGLPVSAFPGAECVFRQGWNRSRNLGPGNPGGSFHKWNHLPGGGAVQEAAHGEQ